MATVFNLSNYVLNTVNRFTMGTNVLTVPSNQAYAGTIQMNSVGDTIAVTSGTAFVLLINTIAGINYYNFWALSNAVLTSGAGGNTVYVSVFQTTDINVL